MLNKFRYPLVFGFLVLILTFCSREKPQSLEAGSSFLNLHDSVDYVGMQTCRSCHNDIYLSFKETGMGKSFDHATLDKTDARFSKHDIVYDESSDFYYQPFFKDSIFYIKEYRLENGDTTHSRLEKVSYIIGSGQHTNSHLVDVNGYIYQAPITFYTQEQRWDLAPGFEDGNNSRFTRLIANECMTCHNHLPEPVIGSDNKYKSVPRGIECERCHGPGEIHVREKLAGNIVDTSKYTDYTIVNPSKLPVELEIDICQRCHLQGTAVLKEGKSFYDFKPGMKLSEVMNVFLPRYTDSDERFIMASQADRMQLSKCFTIGEMSCTSCHNPHHPVKTVSNQQFNKTCNSCHSSPEEIACSAPAEAIQAKKNNCVGCHMPKSGSIDIPHVRITDHYITKPVTNEKKDQIAAFLGLECVTDKDVSELEMAKGYLALYDKFIGDPKMLDSAGFYLNHSKASIDQKFEALVHYYFTQEDYISIIQLVNQEASIKIKDGWTHYRIGESYFRTKKFEAAKKHFQESVQISPYQLEFQNKLGTTLMHLKAYTDAEEVFSFILSENPKRIVALNNLGYLNILQNQPEKAIELYDRALALDPDYENAMMNKLGYFLFKKDSQKALKYALKISKKYPNNSKVIQLIQQLNPS